MTFKHSGDLGDIIWSLPAIKALGGGALFLDPEGGRSEPCVNNGLLFGIGGRGREGRDRHTKLDEKAIAEITPILTKQPYIKSVGVLPYPRLAHPSGPAGPKKPMIVDANLDTFRIFVYEDRTIVSSHCEAMVVPEPPLDEPWMSCDEKVAPPRPILLSRSLRYHSNDEFWVGLRKEIQENACFVGLPFEYEVFCRTFPQIDVPYYETPTLLDLFIAVASCERTITNQGLIHGFAEALKKPTVLEVYRNSRRCVFERAGAVYV